MRNVSVQQLAELRRAAKKAKHPVANHRPPAGIGYNLGAALRQAREKAGMTQVTLAAMSGVTEGYICQIENRRPNVSAFLLHTLAACLGMKLSEFIALAEELDKPAE